MYLFRLMPTVAKPKLIKYSSRSYKNLFVPDEPSSYRIFIVQAGAQIAALIVALLLALAFGALTGLLLKQPAFNNMSAADYFDDSSFWKVSTSLYRL